MYQLIQICKPLLLYFLSKYTHEPLKLLDLNMMNETTVINEIKTR